jgi:hypothetical protein
MRATESSAAAHSAASISHERQEGARSATDRGAVHPVGDSQHGPSDHAPHANPTPARPSAAAELDPGALAAALSRLAPPSPRSGPAIAAPAFTASPESVRRQLAAPVVVPTTTTPQQAPAQPTRRGWGKAEDLAAPAGLTAPSGDSVASLVPSPCFCFFFSNSRRR